MAEHIQILDDRESLGRPLAGSLALHLSLFGAAVAAALIGRPAETWGDPSSFGGGSVGVSVVKQIPLPARSGPVNPVANDSDAIVPERKAEPKPVVKAAAKLEPIDPDAVELKGKNRFKRQMPAANPNKFRAQQKDRENQLYSQSGQALNSPMIGMAGGGTVGVGTGTPFGNRFGYYVDLLRQRVAQRWRTADVDPRLQTAPPVVVTFVILKDGSTRDLRVLQGSGNAVLDISAQRAIADASPFPPLPSGFERNEARIEFQFQLRR